MFHQKNAKGYKPLHYAIQGRRKWSCQLLLDAGADPLEPDPEGNTPLHHLAAARFTPEAANDWVPFFQKFLDLGVDINARKNRGETALFKYFEAECPNFWRHCTAHRDHFGPFAAAGADIFATNDEGETLLHVMARRVYDQGKGMFSTRSGF